MKIQNSNSKIKQWNIVLMMLIACLGIRWIPAAGAIGPSSIIFWILGMVLFFIPLSVIVMELSLNFSEDDGGVYLWVKNAFGNKHGFMTAWFYWTNNLFFYSSILTFIAVNLAYFLGDKELAKNMHFTSIIVISSFWLAIFINIMGFKKIAKVTSFASIINIALVLFIMVSAICYVLVYGHSVTLFNLNAFIPHETVFNNLSNLSLLMFGLAGMELIPTIAKSVENPEKILPRGVLISSVIIMLFYLIGTIAINCIITPSQLSTASGLADAFNLIGSVFHLSFIIKIVLLLLVIVEFGGIILWLITPTIMFFECVESGVLPEFLHKNNRNQVPANAMILQGIIVTIIVLLTNYLPSVNSIYNVLLLISAIIYFLPFLYLSVAYYRLRATNKIVKTLIPLSVAKVIAAFTFLSIVFGIIISLFPSSDIKTTHDLIIYETELIGGPIVFITIGLLLYLRKNRSSI